jgi:hypothetical protein
LKSFHHRKPKAIGGDNSKRNLTVVDHRQHEAWHKLFGTMTPHQIADEINNRWLDPDFKFVVTTTR